jgi:hypothetical protein
MKKIVTLRQALAAKQYFGGQLDGDSWAAWRVLLLAIMGEELTADELVIFQAITNRQKAPAEPVREFTGVIGRRGGKSRAMAVLTSYIATCIDHRTVLAPGERGVIPVLAQTREQSSSVFNFICGALEASPALRGLIENKTAETLSLATGVDVTVRPASFRSVRGISAVAAICDECAFWRSDEVSINPDVEIIRALRPSLLITKGPLISISSPYARRGYLWNTYRRHFGPDGNPKVLVAQASSQTMNPSVDMDWIAEQFDEDPVAAEAEYNAQFRSDVAEFVSLDVLEACVAPGLFEIAPMGGVHYTAFCDPSGGSSDSMTLAIAHRESAGVAVLDCVREVRAPFQPESAVEDFCRTLAQYRVTTVTGDRYGGEWPAEQFRKRNVHYLPSEKSKSDIYKDILPILNSGKCQLLDDRRLIGQFNGLERRTARGGRDSIDHGPGRHDDLANAVAGALCLASLRFESVLHVVELRM